MVVYYGKRMESAQIGRCIVQVECDQCGCEYFFELDRVGTGSATAHYGIGTTGAAESAEDQSERDLQERLMLEAELVPCPECNWISDELVEGYRLGRYRRMGWYAAGVAFFGTIGSWIGAWFIFIGPPIDRGALPYFLFGGPAVFVSIAVMMILFRKYRRGLIRPNRDFPMAPKLPDGTPPALIESPHNNKLQVATPRDGPSKAGDDWIEFQIAHQQIPLVCCDCLKSTTTEHAYQLPLVANLKLEIPRCADCACESKRAYRRVWLVAAAIELIGSCLIFAYRLDSLGFWMLFLCNLLILCALASYVASMKTEPVKIGPMDLDRGIVKLRFRNPEFRSAVVQHAEQMTDANERVVSRPLNDPRISLPS